MSTIKNASAKAKNLEVINLGSLTARLEKVKDVVRTASEGKRSTIYKYPENWSQLHINGKEGRSFRRKARALMIDFLIISVFANQKRYSDLLEEIKKFDINYKANYKINDYSLQSISQSTTEDLKEELTLMLDVIKKVKSETANKKVKAEKKAPTVKKAKVTKVKVEEVKEEVK